VLSQRRLEAARTIQGHRKKTYQTSSDRMTRLFPHGRILSEPSSTDQERSALAANGSGTGRVCRKIRKGRHVPSNRRKQYVEKDTHPHRCGRCQRPVAAGDDGGKPRHWPAARFASAARAAPADHKLSAPGAAAVERLSAKRQ
jgi:hypothetical protein